MLQHRYLRDGWRVQLLQSMLSAGCDLSVLIPEWGNAENLHHEIEEVCLGIDLLPEIEAGCSPVVRNILKIALDDSVRRHDTIIELALNIGGISCIQKHIRKLDENGSADGRAVGLRPSPATSVSLSIDQVLWFT